VVYAGRSVFRAGDGDAYLKRVRLCKLAIEQYQKAPEIGFGSPYRSLEAVKRRLQLSDRENIGSNRHPSPHPNPAQIAATASL